MSEVVELIVDDCFLKRQSGVRLGSWEDRSVWAFFTNLSPPTVEIRRSSSLPPGEASWLLVWRVFTERRAFEHVVLLVGFLLRQFSFWADGPRSLMYSWPLFRPFVSFVVGLWFDLGFSPLIKFPVDKKKKNISVNCDDDCIHGDQRSSTSPTPSFHRQSESFYTAKPP